jgi:hypothetical protein
LGFLFLYKVKRRLNHILKQKKPPKLNLMAVSLN